MGSLYGKEELVTTTINIPRSFYERLKKNAAEEYRSLSRELTKLLAGHFEEEKKNHSG